MMKVLSQKSLLLACNETKKGVTLISHVALGHVFATFTTIVTEDTYLFDDYSSRFLFLWLSMILCMRPNCMLFSTFFH